LVSTPGIAYKILKNLGDDASIRYVIMDESDMMLDDSFEDEIANLLSIIPVKYSRDQPDSAGECF
jgi:superfamily II DNA/RNA helicase